MRRSILFAVLGMAAAVVSSSGQGYIAFNSYAANLGAGAIATFFDGVPLDGSFHADLFYALGTVADPVNGLFASIDPAQGFTDLDVKGVTFSDGYFQGPTVIIPDYVSGPISFEVVAFNGGSSYLNSNIRSRSGAFTESMIVNSASSQASFFGDYGPGMPNIVIALIPEPMTLTLIGLGGLTSLLLFRRKS